MGFTKLEFPIPDPIWGLGGFFPKEGENYGDGDREYNWWGCSKEQLAWETP